MGPGAPVTAAWAGLAAGVFMEPSATHQQTLSAADRPDQAFGPFVLSHRRGRLFRDGEPVSLKPKVHALLVELVAQRDRVLSRDALMEALWPRQVVEESSLTQAIYELRRALGDPGLVENLPRRGYRFTGEVRDLPNACGTAPEADAGPDAPPDTGMGADATAAAEPVPPARRPPPYRLAAGAMLALALSLLALSLFAPSLLRPGDPAADSALDGVTTHDPARIVVLPFKDISADGGLEFLGDGIADTLQRSLAGVAELSVIARASAFAYRDRDIASIAGDLHAGTVLDGSVQRAGNRLRVSAQLVRTADQTQLWSAVFEREASDIFAIQDDIADRVLEAVTGGDALGLQLAPLRQTSREAYDLYLQGRELWQRRDAASIREAIARLEDAVRLDPGFAPARSELATALYLSPDLSRLEKVARIEPQLEAALALDPADAQSHALRGNLLLAAGRIVEGREALERALALRPNDVNILGWLAQGYQVSGLLRSAHVHIGRAYALDPMNVHARTLLVGSLLSESPSEALSLALQTVRLFPESQQAWWHLARVHLARGDRVADALAAADALAHLQEAPPLVFRIAATFNEVGEFALADAWRARIQDFEPGPQAELFWHLNRGDARAVAERTAALLARHGPTPDALAWHGRALIGAGEYAEAEAMLERALAAGPDLRDAANISWSQAEVPVLLAGMAIRRGDIERARALEAMALPAIDAVRDEWPRGAQERAFFLDVAMQRYAEAAARLDSLPFGFFLTPLVEGVPLFEGLRAEPAAQAVLAREARQREHDRQRLLDSAPPRLVRPDDWPDAWPSAGPGARSGDAPVP